MERVTKADLRREMRRRLGEISATRAEKSRAIVAAITSHPLWKGVNTVALFSSLSSEPDLSGLWGRGSRRFCYPRIEIDHMEFFEVLAVSELVRGSRILNLLEPAPHSTRAVAPEEIDLILVPGLAFTRDGHRLGRGGGYYDRYLSRVPPSTVRLGVCFDCQIEASLPLDGHDQQVHAVVAENGFSGDAWHSGFSATNEHE